LKRIWKEILSGCGINDDQMALLENQDSVEDWWTKVDLLSCPYRGKFGRSIMLMFSNTFYIPPPSSLQG
jgi:hypothetical protein